jgi:alanine dehydrogenase
MNISVPRETGRHERRVGLTPWAAGQLVRSGHTVLIEKGAGQAARFDDREYQEAGAAIVYNRDETFQRAHLVCGVELIAAADLDLVRPESVLLGFQHLAVAPRKLIDRLQAERVTAIGYELVEDPQGRRHILTVIGEMAGGMAVDLAAHHLQNEEGGRGILLGSVPGVPPSTVLILGAGTVGRTAAARAHAAGAHVIVLDEDLVKLRELKQCVGPQVISQLATADRLAQYTAIADVVIGAVLVPGERAPFLVTEDMVRRMRTGSVIVDVSIDQGGCVETSRPTDIKDPTFVAHGVVHYCVPNMTANVARTASRALSDTVLPLVATLAGQGLEQALRCDAGLAAGVYLYKGRLVNEQLARALGAPATPLGALLPSEERP